MKTIYNIIFILLFSSLLSANSNLRVLNLARNGDALAQYNLAMELKDKNQRDSFKWMHKSALRGYPPAQYEFALMFHYGIGVRKSFELARLWFKRASKRGERKAQVILYRFYAGKKVESIHLKQQHHYSQNFRRIRQ